MKPSPLLAAMKVAAALLMSPLAVPAVAGEGHDHGKASPAATGLALPRFAAVSETFELVGVLKGRQLTLYLDRAADNAPVIDAQIELEVAGTRLQVDKHDDAYAATLTTEPKPGVLPVTATITAGQDVDLLAGELDLHEAAHADDKAPVRSWKPYTGWAAAAVAVLVVLTLVVRRVMASRQRRLGATA